MTGQAGAGSGGPRRWLAVLGVVTGLWLFTPTLAVLPMSLNASRRMSVWPQERSLELYGELFGNPTWYESLLRSFRIAAIVTVLATLMGTAVAFAVARGFNPRRGAVLNALILAPIIVPIVVASVSLYAVFLQWQLVGTELALILAHTSLGIPFVVLPVLANLRGVEQQLESAAQSLGAAPAQAVWLVTIPLIRPGIVVGAFLAFMQSFDEVVMSLFLAGPRTRTLPVRMYSALVDDLDPTVAAASGLVLLVTVLAVLTAGVSRLAKARTV
jgi:putative spermidine/putrescine transport system permease protein